MRLYCRLHISMAVWVQVCFPSGHKIATSNLHECVTRPGYKEYFHSIIFEVPI